jgi:uncharacterized membrane-anchored protein YhcB (DUF1043 family)
MAYVSTEKTKELIKKEAIPIQFDSFALKILLQQLRTRYSLNKDEETLSESIKKVEEFFKKMEKLDTVKRDFKKIYGRELNV